MALVRDLGGEVNESLPLLDEKTSVLRSLDDVIDRTLCVFVAVATAYGFDRAKALEWATEQALTEAVTSDELALLNGDGSKVNVMKQRVEALYALTWSLGRLADLDFRSLSPSTLVHIFPNLKTGESSLMFRRNAKLVSDVEAARKLDAIYCLHWAATASNLGEVGSQAPLPLYAIVERRRSLEWLVSDDDFENVMLDT